MQPEALIEPPANQEVMSMNSKQRTIGFVGFATLFIGLAFGTFFSSSCTNARKVALQTKLNELTAQSDQLQRNLAEQESVLEASTQRLSAQRAALGEYNAQIQGYLLDHKMAVAAIGVGVAGIGTLDPGNKYSEDVKTVGGTAALVAAFWAISNVDEVSEVLKTLNQANAHVHSLEAGISQTSSAVQQEQAGIAVGEERLRSLDHEKAALGQELRGF